MKAVIFACRLEADPFIEKFSFTQTSEYPFEVFKSDGDLLFVSGIGPLAAALCADFAVKSGATRILNAGACGDLTRSRALGTVLEVSKVVSAEPYCRRTFDLERPGETLISSSRPVSEDGERNLLSRKAGIVDMEGYGLLSALVINNFDLKNFTSLKFVSDFSQACNIEENIKKHINCLEPHIARWLV